MSNPVMNNMLGDSIENETVIDANSIMTINGTIRIAFILGLIVFTGAYISWTKFMSGYADYATILTIAGSIGAFIMALIISFTRNKYLVPIYAGLEGLALGGISFFFEKTFPGIVFQAVSATFATLFVMLFLYRFNIIKATEKFKSVVFISTISVAGIYLIDFIAHFFGHGVPLLYSSSNFGILITFVIIVIAALNLIIDFDFIENGANRMLPKDFEWFGAFGLMVTLVWIYVEMLRLLSKLQSRK